MKPRMCGNCTYFDPDPNEDSVGACRRYAPRPAAVDLPWPTVVDSDWCGEFAESTPS